MIVTVRLYWKYYIISHTYLVSDKQKPLIIKLIVFYFDSTLPTLTFAITWWEMCSYYCKVVNICLLPNIHCSVHYRYNNIFYTHDTYFITIKCKINFRSWLPANINFTMVVDTLYRVALNRKKYTKGNRQKVIKIIFWLI